MTPPPSTPATTMEEDQPDEGAVEQPRPGLVLFFSVEQPMLRVFPLVDGARELGWGDIAGPEHEDARVSRRHLRARYDGVLWHLEDLGSRNGSFVDGERIAGTVAAPAPRVVRIGRSLFLASSDVRRFQRSTVEAGDAGVIGPTLRGAWDAVALAARAGDTLLITGESGTGKELAARAFHAAGAGAQGPFVAVNCAAIPKGVAERLLFGARRGAYSGAAADADGYLQAADGGTLFLDEIGDIDLAVQAKLLRVLELRAVTPLGAAHPVPVNLRVCAATCQDIHGQVATGGFREDLYFRIGRPEVSLPPLRDRLEEIPYLLARELAAVDAGLRAHVVLVEACALRPWPGNVRELCREAHRSAHAALEEGRTVVEPRDLSVRAGLAMPAPAHAAAAPAPGPARAEPRAASPRAADEGDRDAAAGGDDSLQASGRMVSRDAIGAALRAEAGNVTRAARALGLHRNQLRRYLERTPFDPAEVGAPISEDDEDDGV